ncbi:methylmalonic aciduria and homocystinuria type D protein [Anabaena subtropica]|uniref:Methylmalonic aciduria and homocystinuria type D protein n=1 Tax=Anabaena subtropica FACHB-260 TaxID=2692884 RepID=A0ABR8CJ54_9NOST|nr:methylmalonic aciduria and homocystinuria type D protein [Anabaena subtropica]MBD2342553.1 methylmalonic aciduria and homocystinuria type D protein [Anabaena subtropica FACHB-260]
MVNYPIVYAAEQSRPINLVGKKGLEVQIYIHSPSPYICANRERILPDWQEQTLFWVVIVLQQSQYPLVKSTAEIEREKERLREKFMRFGCDLAFNLHDRGYMADLIDPRTGYPLLSRPGEIPHNDTAVVKALLNYPVLKNKCSVIVHPTWGTAVYPSIFISAAPPMIVEWAIRSIASMHGWQEVEEESVVSSQ